MEHFPGRGLSVDAPPVDSSLTRGFSAEGMPFLSYYGISASSALANGGTDVAYSHLCAVFCDYVYVCVSLLHWHIRDLYMCNECEWVHAHVCMSTRST